jgi:hypothetical protein
MSSRVVEDAKASRTSPAYNKARETGDKLAKFHAYLITGTVCGRRALGHPLCQGPRQLTALLVRRPAKVAAIALANKLARMAWAMMAKGERYRNPVALAA